MDSLSVALRSIQMSGSLIARAELSAPWGLGLERFGAAVFHVVLSGSAWLRTEEGRTIRLSAGDVAVLMRGQRHELVSEPGVPITSFADLMQHCVPGRFPAIGIAGGGEREAMLCGFFKFERETSHPLLRALPDVIHVNAGSGAGMIEGIVALADAESAMPRPGSGALTDLLCGLLLLQVLRAQLAVDPLTAAPWIHSLEDTRVGAALELMNESPQRDWTVARLAAAVLMSRSNFAQRFAVCVGESPMRYLARCRIVRAARLLDAERLSVTEAMQRVRLRVGVELHESIQATAGVHAGGIPKVTANRCDVRSTLQSEFAGAGRRRLPIDRIDPALPMLRIEPVLPMLRIEPELPMLKIDPALAMLQSERTLNRLATLKRLYALNALPRLA